MVVKDGYIEMVNDDPDITIMSLKRDYPAFFYNQDWYDREEFASIAVPVGKHRFAVTTNQGVPLHGILPSANVCTWAFIRAFCLHSTTLWPENYIWCKDTDSFGDQVYVGGYRLGSKKGFEIHRFIKLKSHHHSLDYSFSN